MELIRSRLVFLVLLFGAICTTDAETLDASYKENVKDYTLRIPFVFVVGLASILEFRAENAAAAKKLDLEKIYDNLLLQEI